MASIQWRLPGFGLRRDDYKWINHSWQRSIIHNIRLISLHAGTVCIDIGCGEGHCARFFAQLGCEILGVDGSRIAARDSVIPRYHVTHDFVTGPYVPSKRYDLVWSCEFVEHVEERFANNFLAAFAKAEKCIAMTYAAPGQPGWHHVNCQPESYWIEKMSAIGYRFDEALTRDARRLALLAAAMTYNPEIGHARATITAVAAEAKAAQVSPGFNLTLASEYAFNAAEASPWLLGIARLHNAALELADAAPGLRVVLSFSGGASMNQQ